MSRGSFKTQQRCGAASRAKEDAPSSRSVPAAKAAPDRAQDGRWLEFLDAQGIRPKLSDLLPQTRGTGAERATVYPSSPVADRHEANAVTLDNAVHLSSALSAKPTSEQKRVLAHEAVHIAQHSVPGAPASKALLEEEASQLSSQVLSGQKAQPQFHADAATVLTDAKKPAEDGGPLPGDRIAVEKAKQRRAVLLEVQKRRAEYEKLRAKRQKSDAAVPERLAQLEQKSGQPAKKFGEYLTEEAANVLLLNTKPIRTEITPKVVRIRAKFHVRFEGLTDKEAAAKFPAFKNNFEQAVSNTWSRNLSADVMGGRAVELIPALTLIPANAARDTNFWLITIRPTDKSVPAYENQPFPTTNPLMAVTDPTLDGGVMSLPPKAMTDTETLGHETLHLFGMADRYASITIGGNELEAPLRADESDPLTGGGGKIAEGDVGFALEAIDADRSISDTDLRLELKNLEKIIETGRDPDSMIKKRQDFTDKTIKTAEDLD